MRVILTEKVPHLGNVGEIVNVSAGHGRNYLIPKGVAIIANEGNTAELKHYQKLLAKKVEEEKAKAVAIQKKLEGLTLKLIKKVGGNGKLFGTVTTHEISKELETKDIHVEKRVMTVDKPIKELGSYVITAKIFKGVEASFNVKVEIDPKQAIEIQKKLEEQAAEKVRKAEEAEKLKLEGGAEGEVNEEELSDEEKLKREADELLRS